MKSHWSLHSWLVDYSVTMANNRIRSLTSIKTETSPDSAGSTFPPFIKSTTLDIKWLNFCPSYQAPKQLYLTKMHFDIATFSSLNSQQGLDLKIDPKKKKRIYHLLDMQGVLGWVAKISNRKVQSVLWDKI